jgi:hypothetical protein
MADGQWKLYLSTIHLTTWLVIMWICKCSELVMGGGGVVLCVLRFLPCSY